jgi:enoyl-CoA hydratase/carnithine racemase
MTDSGLRLDIDGAVATVTLQRPERRNAMTPGTWRGLAAIGAELPPPVRVVVVPGDGLDAAVAGLVAALLANDAATVRATKHLLAGAPGRTLEEQAAAERAAQIALQRSR